MTVILKTQMPLMKISPYSPLRMRMLSRNTYSAETKFLLTMTSTLMLGIPLEPRSLDLKHDLSPWRIYASMGVRGTIRNDAYMRQWAVKGLNCYAQFRDTLRLRICTQAPPTLLRVGGA